MDPICKNCRHYRQTNLIDVKTGLPRPFGYCHASRNYARRNETDTCKRYHYNPELALKQ